MSTTPAISLDVSVVITNKNHKNSLESFAHALGLAVEILEEVPFQDIYTPTKDFAHAFFSNQGTLFFIPSGEYNIAAASRASEVAFLDIVQSTASFNLEYAKDGSMQRIYTNFNGTVRRNIKAPLEWESSSKSYVEIMSDAIQALTGQSLELYQQDKAARYHIIK
ncbi:hypothetical protein [Aureispira sp. CCB-E]|uniref:hypothetical protein n=1 Tax=Aureispira sp. CCB-E TaxID=3051121 RepID=UPI002868CA49|nr:hypothetical protein [Aureispira sp. CCB-E]WMX15725.1 hypothetical protein QP953_04930 [Aureispira sp. CCB-E]